MPRTPRPKPKSPIDGLKARLGLRGADAERLRALRARIAPRLDEIVKRVLDRLSEERDPGRGDTDPPERPGEQEALGKLIRLLLGGRYGRDYALRRERIVSAFRPPRVPFRWPPGASGVLLEEILALPETLVPDDPEGRLVLSSLGKALLFDLEIACRPSLARVPGSDPESPGDLDERTPGGPDALLVSEAMLTTLAQNYPEMVLAVDPEGRIVEANRAALSNLGYEEEEIRRLSFHHLIAASHHPRIRMHLERTVREGKDRVEVHLLSRSGEEKHVEIHSAAVRNEEGRYLGARIFIRDLTDRKRLEQEMLRLERLVAVGSMAAKVAHEIRNPLSSISLNVELLLDEIRRFPAVGSSEAESLVGSILSEIDRLTNVIEEYLSFGRLPSPSLEPVDAEGFLQSIAEFVRPELQERNIDLSIEVLSGTPPLLADRNQVRQSILNLFRNSQEAMPSGGRIRVVAGTKDGEVVIEVRDTGVGIPKEEIRKIFGPFYTTKAYGTGLGLAFVQQVMREHGGRIACRSDPGSDTVFTLFFPSASGSAT
ncbi:MAG: PAS domain S-box protein [Candidatus Eisenbacteria bacterium]|nr:PAS domain S-box protein [Candidatus Eisenbacteria bacterium]